MLAIPIIGDIIGFVATPFQAAAGWAWDTVVGGITDWILKGVLALLMSMWNFMDTASSPRLTSEWFYTADSSPFRIAFGIGVTMVALLVLFALIRGVAAGSPGAVIRTVGHDLPVAIFAMVSLVVVAAAAVDLSDGLSDFIWSQTRDDAIDAFDNLGVTLMAGLPNMHFMGIVIALVLLAAMLFMWVTLFVREALIYIVVIYAVSFGLPSMIFPPLRDTAKKVLELLVALIIAKPVMVLALSVGVSALGGIGATGEPGDPVGDNLARELGTLVSGVIMFGLAAFMPFLVWKLMPIVAAAVVAQGIASAPMRGGTQAMQLQYYGQTSMRRLAGGSGGGGAPVGRMATGSTGSASAGGAGFTSGVAASGGGSSTAAAGAAAGPAAPLVVAASAARAATSATKSAVTSAAESATSNSSPPSAGGRSLGGDRS
ncbi:MAG: type IV secretion system protein [Ilumatobacter sp.]|uniref:type IV secretion system protein n=1 Tax=Ilumatobacter sp. TaxID=1967498 RepID=UPI00391971F5